MRFVLLLALLAGPGSAAPDAAPPKERNLSYRADEVRQSLRPITHGLDPAHAIRALTGRRREAENVDAADQVRLPSTWWTPRLGYRTVTPEAMLEATGADQAPAAGPWTIVKAKQKGVSPGFQIVDSAGTRWAIKLDPIHEPELTTAADAITSRLLWAAGYNVPVNVVVTFERGDLKIKPGLKVEAPGGHEHLFDDARLDTILARGARLPDGRWRALASRFLSGKPLGEFLFEGRRDDDPEDRIPHQHRRELRGLWVIAAWVNDDDCSARNTLDTWVTENGRSFVRHHLLDFSSTLGAASAYRHPYRTGYEYTADVGVIARNSVTLGLVRPRWEHAVDPRIPGVGFIDAATFDPEVWRPLIPNPAFDACTRRDIRWAARIVAAFDEPLVRAAVRQGRFRDPRAEDYLVRVLLERRDRIVRVWGERDTVAAASRR